MATEQIDIRYQADRWKYPFHLKERLLLLYKPLAETSPRAADSKPACAIALAHAPLEDTAI